MKAKGRTAALFAKVTPIRSVLSMLVGTADIAAELHV
jgi:hypothetical protein